MAAAEPLLEANGIERRFGGLAAVQVEHLRVERGGITALIGPNGAGKSTLFNILSGFDRPLAGRWSLAGQPLEGLGPESIAQLGLVRTFQLTAALPGLTVLENTMLGAQRQAGERLRHCLAPWRWRGEERAIEARSREWLERLGLDAMADAPAETLSGGQRKLLELARALMTEPRLLLLDEPMAGVNPVLREALLEHIRAVNALGTTILLIEHDLELVRRIADRVLCLAAGRIVAEGSAQSVAANPVVVEAYLGVRQRELEAAAASSAVAGTPLLSIRGLVAGYVSGIDIVRGVDVEVCAAEVVGVFGPNGAGKSTLLKALLGLAERRAGSVRLAGRDVTDAPGHELVALGVGYVPQLENVFGALTVEENLRMGLFIAPRRWRERLHAVLALFPALEAKLGIRAGYLSGGERQMLALGRALMTEPRLLLLDEPSAGLAPALQTEVFEHVRRIAAAGVAILIVEQNARRCLEICQRGYILDQGRNAHQGSGRELLDDARVVELYLGSLGASHAA